MVVEFVKLTRPETYKLVEVTFVANKLVTAVLPKFVRPEIYRLVEVRLVPLILTSTEEVVKKLVEVRLVKTPVDGLVAPIGTLLIEPPVRVSEPATIASVTESAGNDRTPVTARFVEVPDTITVLVANNIVLVTAVNTPVEGVVAPIGVLSIAPPLIVRAFTTMALVIESFGKFTFPEIYKFVLDTFTKMAFVEVRLVPDAEEKNNGPDKVPPERGK